MTGAGEILLFRLQRNKVFAVYREHRAGCRVLACVKLAVFFVVDADMLHDNRDVSALDVADGASFDDVAHFHSPCVHRDSVSIATPSL